MERHQSAPPLTLEEPTPPSLRLPGLEALSLKERVETLRGPGVTSEEVDALLAALERPLAADESPRARADLLLTLLEDERVGSFTGTGERPVREAALESLLALGYPYALEVPPEALDRVRGWRFQPPSRSMWVGLGLAVSTALAQSVFWSRLDELFPLAPFIVGPSLLAMPAAWLGFRKVQGLLNGVTWLLSGGCLLLAWLLLESNADRAWGLTGLYSGLALGAAAFCQRPREEP